MFDRIWGRVEKAESKLRNKFGNSIDTPWQRLLSIVHFYLMDHALLRILWTNFYQFGPEAYRSINHQVTVSRNIKNWEFEQ